MQIVVDMAEKRPIEIGARGLAGLEQEVRMVLATRKGSVPLDRDFGLVWDFVDLSMTEAMQRMIAEISQQLEKYVPRIRVMNISFSSDEPVEGLLEPKVTIQIRDEYMDEFRDELNFSGVTL